MRTAREFIRSQNGRVSPLAFSEEEADPQSQRDLTKRVSALEDTGSCYQVPYDASKDSGESEFRYFTDGRQRTVQIGYLPLPDGIVCPIHYFAVSAVILQRVGRQLSVWREPLLREGLVIEHSLLPDPSILDVYRSGGLEIVDAQAEHPRDYYKLRQSTLSRVKSLRQAAEEELIAQWTTGNTDPDEFLVVDGSLTDLRQEEGLLRCVGVIKSFASRYFSAQEHGRFMSMPEFYRSWTFRFNVDEREAERRTRSNQRLSWYLRLRTGHNVDPEFGLIRVEISRHHVDNVGEMAERFSRSLLSERSPTSHPKPRWHNHLYPVSRCEDYLSSIMPSLTKITAAMKS